MNSIIDTAPPERPRISRGEVREPGTNQATTTPGNLPGRTLTRNQATTAMVLAERVSHGARDQHHKDWPFIEGWAEELGLSGADAVTKISYYGGGLLAGE